MIKHLPNALTIVRIIVTLIIVALSVMQISHLYSTLLVLFIAAALTDYADGEIARKANVVSSFGKVFDPLSDKILVFVMLIILYPTGTIPTIAILLLIVRDLVIDGIRSYFASHKVIIPAIFTAKIKTTTMFLVVISALIELLYGSMNIHGITVMLSILAVGFSYISALQYAQIFWNARNRLE